MIKGVIDGDLSGGNPKAVLFEAGSDIGDLSTYGFGSANNGGGSDGEEFTFSGSITTGQLIIVTANGTSDDFFSDNFVQDFVHFKSTEAGFTASVNGDDAIELFQGGSVIDTYGDINVNGDGETWDYTDGYAVRTGGVAGVFDQANYNSQFQGLDTLAEADQIATIAANFPVTAIPEPGAFAVIGLASLVNAFRYRRRNS